MDWTWILIGSGAGAVTMFVWLGVCWMVLPHHKADFRGVPHPEGLERVLTGLPAGKAIYCFPFVGDYAGGQGDPALKSRMEAGPNALITVLPRGDGMGAAVFLRGLLLNLVDGFGLAVLCSLLSLPTLWDKALACALAGAFAGITVNGGMSNWMFQPLRFTVTSVLDRIVGYALVGMVLHLCLPAAAPVA